MKNQKVNALNDPVERTWDVDLVLDMFEDEKANLILSIPININEGDNWYWCKEKMGNYYVISAYPLLQQSKTYNNKVGNTGFLRFLRNLKILPKIKNFLWRDSSNCLPIIALLHVGKVLVIDLCPLCNETSESILHIMVTCSYADTCPNKMQLSTVTKLIFILSVSG